MRRNICTDDSFSPWSAEYFDVLPKSVLLDIGGSPDLSGAEAQIAAAQQQSALATQKSIDAIQQMYAQGRADIAPWREAGGGAVGQWSAFMGIPTPAGTAAPTGVTPGADQLALLQNWPGLQFLQQQGTQAQARLGSATGLMGSGAAQKGAQSYGQNLALTYALQPYLANLQNISQQGLTGSTATAQFGMESGLGQARTYQAGAQQNAALAGSMANLLGQQAIYEANAQNSIFGDILGGIGFLSSGLGGLSGILSGDWSGGLSSLFGGGGGGGAGGTAGLTGYSALQSQAMGGAGGFGWDPYMFKQQGGPVGGNQPAIVGEAGPELFVPKQDGYIIPNHNLTRSDFSAFTPWRPGPVTQPWGSSTRDATMSALWDMGGVRQEDIALAPWRY